MLTSSLLRPRSDSCRSRSPGNYVSFSLSFFAFALLRTHVVVVVAIVVVVVISPDATPSPAPAQCISSFRQSSMSSPTFATHLADTSNRSYGGNTPRVLVTLRVKFSSSSSLSFRLPTCCRLVSIGSCTPFIRLVFGFLLHVPPTSPRRRPRPVERFRPLSVCPAISRLDWGHRQETLPPPFCFTHSRLYRTCRRRPPLCLCHVYIPCFSTRSPPPPPPHIPTCFVPHLLRTYSCLAPLCRLFPFHPCLFNQVLFSIPSLQICVCIKSALAKTRATTLAWPLSIRGLAHLGAPARRPMTERFLRTACVQLSPCFKDWDASRLRAEALIAGYAKRLDWLETTTARSVCFFEEG